MGRGRLLRLLLIALTAAITLVVLLNHCPHARGDVGGTVPAPGLCEYPAVCASGQIMNVYYYWEDFPTELNGSHRHCQWGGYSIDAMGGVSILMFQAGISGHVGGLTGSCFYVCPDMSRAEFPNPPGGWKDAIRPTKCKTIGPNPFEVDAPVSPPIAAQGAVPAQPFVEPPPPPEEVPPPAAPEPPLSQELPSVTNPACPNPDATVTSSCG